MGKKKRRKTKLTRLQLCAIVGIPSLIFLAAAIVFGFSSYETGKREERYRPMIVQTARRHDVPVDLALAVVRQESNFNPDAVGDAGERGLMQVTRGAAADWERETRRTLHSDNDLFNPELNVEIGTWYLAKALRQFDGHRHRDVLALSQYNAGRSRALKWAADYPENLPDSIPISSTRCYILRIEKYRSAYRNDGRK